MTMKNDSGTCGIYKITRKDTGQAYIGLSENIERRWNEHIHSPKLKHSYIDRAIRKHGLDKFHLEIVEELPNDRALLAERERYWIAYYNTYKDGSQFNLTPGGDISPSKLPEIKAKISKAHKGKIFSEETRKKMSEAAKGREFSEDTRKKISEANKGKKCSEEARKKISEANKGKKRSKDTRKKISEANKGKKIPEEVKRKISKSLSGENNPMYGKKGEEAPFFGCKHTPETKKKMSEAQKGKKLSKETRKKISEKRIGIPISDEVKKKISCATNTTGFFRVDKSKCSDCKNGFTYRYRYHDDDGKHRSITSVDIKKLEKKVKAKGLEWFKLEE